MQMTGCGAVFALRAWAFPLHWFSRDQQEEAKSDSSGSGDCSTCRNVGTNHVCDSAFSATERYKKGENSVAKKESPYCSNQNLIKY
ncbi:hypothetical protein EK904_012075 [Melospiza melodia maxima]|nr:hypothetical protein EK904_012075 [Melospiza melodia maxima]